MATLLWALENGHCSVFRLTIRWLLSLLVRSLSRCHTCLVDLLLWLQLFDAISCSRRNGQNTIARLDADNQGMIATAWALVRGGAFRGSVTSFEASEAQAQSSSYLFSSCCLVAFAEDRAVRHGADETLARWLMMRCERVNSCFANFRTRA